GWMEPSWKHAEVKRNDLLSGIEHEYDPTHNKFELDQPVNANPKVFDCHIFEIFADGKFDSLTNGKKIDVLDVPQMHMFRWLSRFTNLPLDYHAILYNKPLSGNCQNGHIRVTLELEMVRIIEGVNKGVEDYQRADVVNSIVYEASARVKDPIHGCAGVVQKLQKKIADLESQLATTQAELVNIRLNWDELASLVTDGSPVFEPIQVDDNDQLWEPL
ncbi:hypothetical protein KI387_002868, partial [Taxus chinensis]